MSTLPMSKRERHRAALEHQRKARERVANHYHYKHIHISRTGAIALYGFGRFPLTLYASEWEDLARVLPSILNYIRSQPYGLWRSSKELHAQEEQAAEVDEII